MLFWILTVCLLLLAAAFILVPMWRHHREQRVMDEQDRKGFNLAIFRERLRELEAERDSGAFDEQQFQALRTELERSLLSDIDEQAPEGTVDEQTREQPGWLSAARLVPIVAVLAIMPLSYLAYQWWGHQDDLHLARIIERSQQADEAEEVRDVIFELGPIVERDPDNGWAWYFLARNLTQIGQTEQAGTAFQRAAENIDNPQDKAAVLGQYAQVQFMQADRQITEEVQQTIDRARRLNPDEQSVLQLLSTDAFLREDYQDAITYWQRMLNQSSSEENRRFLRSAIQQARQNLEGEQVSASGSSPAQEAESGPVVEVEVSLAGNIDLPPETRVFVSAQSVGGGSGPPLAVTTLSVGELPAQVRLSDSDAVGPRSLSSADSVRIVATASRSGSADVQSGDYRTSSDTIQLQGEETRVTLEISDRVP